MASIKTTLLIVSHLSLYVVTLSFFECQSFFVVHTESLGKRIKNQVDQQYGDNDRQHSIRQHTRDDGSEEAAKDDQRYHNRAQIIVYYGCVLIRMPLTKTEPEIAHCPSHKNCRITQRDRLNRRESKHRDTNRYY